MHSSVHQTETLLFNILLQLIVMIAAARLANQLLRRLGQPGIDAIPAWHAAVRIWRSLLRKCNFVVVAVRARSDRSRPKRRP